ncbi:hypothetical protein B296_00058895 [Ensete ventricosum]|uniref:Uncharacterized protein n=1 Tax=Ensete ventricosum TaxID=4639 RepID=A0A426WWD4_ENSVE|nr:hypothetical protein B296_00058895 [Ensete ventricosum]
MRPLAHEVAACAAFPARGRHLMRLRLAAYGRPVCSRRLMRLPPTRDRPSARHGPFVAWPTLLLVCTLSAAAGRSN